MSQREDKIISHIHEYERILLFFKDNPDILRRYGLALTRRRADDADTNSSFGKQRDDDIP